MNNDGLGSSKGYTGGLPGVGFMARRNNLMSSNNNQLEDTLQNQRRPHRVPSMSGGNSAFNGGEDDGQHSVYSMRSNPFYPAGSGQSTSNYMQKQLEDKKQEHDRREKNIEEWGF